MENFDLVLLGNALSRWGLSFGIFVLVLLSLVILKRILVRRLSALAKKTETDLDDFGVQLLSNIRPIFLGLLALVGASVYLHLSEAVHHFLKSFFIVSILIQAMFWGQDAIRFFLRRSLTKRELKRGRDPALQMTISALEWLLRMALYVIILLLILDNLGFNITALLAGLGVGGIAVALAAQNILGDLFASLSIIIDKPFVIGDYIEVGTQKGRVEKIGLKTTRIRSITGEQLVLSNTDLLGSRICNFERMEERRVLFSLGVTYQTSAAKLKKIPDILEKIISKQEKARFDRAHFKSFGDSALYFEVVYFVTTREASDYVAAEAAINLEIVKVFQEEQIDFAYPTRTLLIEKSA